MEILIWAEIQQTSVGADVEYRSQPEFLWMRLQAADRRVAVTLHLILAALRRIPRKGRLQVSLQGNPSVRDEMREASKTLLESDDSNLGKSHIN